MIMWGMIPFLWPYRDYPMMWALLAFLSGSYLEGFSQETETLL
jgi:hypothetical protein